MKTDTTPCMDPATYLTVRTVPTGHMHYIKCSLKHFEIQKINSRLRRMLGNKPECNCPTCNPLTTGETYEQ